MTIDSHQHFWKYDPQKHSWISEEMNVIRKDFQPEDLLPVLQKNQIDGCIAVQVEHNRQETAALLSHASRFDFIKGVVGWVDLSAENLTERLQEYSGVEALKGFRHTEYDEKGEFLLKPSFQKGIGELQKSRFTFDLLVFPHQLGSAIKLARTFPEQLFVLDHLGKPRITAGPSPEWATLIKELGSCQNVYAKLSGMVTETDNLDWIQSDLEPFLDVMLESFGTGRLMFGSDWPVCTSTATYEEVVEIVRSYFNTFSDDERKAILGRNAVEFYGLHPS